MTPRQSFAAVALGSSYSLYRWTLLSIGGLAVLIAAAFLRGTPEESDWYVLHIVPGVLVVLFCATTIGRLIGASALIVNSLTLPTLTLLAAFNVVTFWRDGIRIQLFTDSPNLLGAGLVVGVLGTIAVQPRTKAWALWLPVVALATAFTGSRTALLALLAGWGVYTLLRARDPWFRWVTLAAALLVVAFALLSTRQAIVEAGSPNLLRMTTSFGGSAWDAQFAREVLIQRAVAPGPMPSTRADRIAGAASNYALILLQSVGRSVAGAPYIGSVYLRADVPQDVVLSTQMSRAVCRVSRTWQRCQTPVAFGDGLTNAQLRLEATEVGGSIDVYAYGPQLENSLVALPYAPRGTRFLPADVVERFGLLGGHLHAYGERVPAMAIALARFRESPVVGVGISGLATSFAPADGSNGDRSAAHAHNFLLERLAAEGVLGLLGWFLVLGTTAAFAFRGMGTHVLPLMVAVLILNSLDNTLLFSGSYFTLFVVFGLSWHTRQ